MKLTDNIVSKVHKGESVINQCQCLVINHAAITLAVNEDDRDYYMIPQSYIIIFYTVLNLGQLK